MAGAEGGQSYHLHVPIVLKSGSLSLLEPSGPVQGCKGIALRKCSILHISHPASEDGTDRVFRNVGILQFNQTPGKYPKEYIHLDSKHSESLKSRITLPLPLPLPLR